MLGSESSTSFSLTGTLRKFQGTKLPPMELSLPGAKVRGNESSIIRDRVRVRVRARVWIVWDMDAQTAVQIHTDNSPEMTHLSVWIRTDNNTNQYSLRLQNPCKSQYDNDNHCLKL